MPTADPIFVNITPREEECAVCEAVILEGNKGIAMFEGEPVPHDWTGEWGGFACCATCFAEYERVQASESERAVWWARKRREARMQPVELIYMGDL